jgi:acetoacetyl-CoA synthetase
MTIERPILWTPSPAQANATKMARYIAWLKESRGLNFACYDDLWHWSTHDLEAFWSSIWDFFDLQSSKPHSRVLAQNTMPGAVWFPGATLNFTDQVLRHADSLDEQPALIMQSETFGHSAISWAELAQQTGSVAAHFRAMGVGKGDRVVAILSNTIPSVIAFLATTSLGAIWSICAPDMGNLAILDRFRQIEPKLLIAQDQYIHAGKPVDRSAVVTQIAAALPSLTHQIEVTGPQPLTKGRIKWRNLTRDSVPISSTQVPFDHPLWIVYSSGTTGNPKPIVHSHGGILVEQPKQSLHQDLQVGDRFSWLTSSGWIMWNVQFTALAQGATLALFDGAPNHPDLGEIWRFVGREQLTYFGAGAAFFSACLKAGIRPSEIADLSALRRVGSTGFPLTSEAYDWVYETVKADIWLAPISGGTDLAGAFVIGNPMQPVRSGEMQCRALGNAVHAFDAAGNALIGKVGELVCTEPLPSMPLFFGATPAMCA